MVRMGRSTYSNKERKKGRKITLVTVTAYELYSRDQYWY